MKDWRDWVVAIAVTANQEYIPSDFMWNMLNIYKPKKYSVIRQSLHIKSASLNAHLWKAKQLGAEKILFMDVDMEFPLNTIQQLLSHDEPIVSGLYHTKVSPYSPIAGWTKEVGGTLMNVNGDGLMWKENYCPLPQDQMVEVDWCGIGCLMVDMDVFDKIKYPCFRDVWDDNTGTRALGHDVVLCRAVKDAGYKIYVDTRVDCGHKVSVYAESKWIRAWHRSKFQEVHEKEWLEWSQEKAYWDMQWAVVRDGIEPPTRGPVKEEVQRIMAYIPDNVSVADLACGGGYLLSVLKAGAYCDVVGYDFSETSMKVMDKRGIKHKLADIRTYEPGPDEKYHTVVMSHVLEHFEDEHVDRAIELAKSMAEEQVIISIPAETTKWIEHAQQWDEAGLKELLERHFDNVELTKIDRDEFKSERVPYNIVAQCKIASVSEEMKLAANI